MNSTYINPRFKDVLFALNSASQHNTSLGRIQLQKLIYLADTLTIISTILTPVNGHINYKYGPYDKNIQSSVTALAFRGFVSVSNSFGKKIHYKLSKQGLELVDRIKETPELGKRFEFYNLIGNEINKRGWNKLKALVYSEPAYLSHKPDPYGYRFKYDSIQENESLRILRDFERMFPQGVDIGTRNLVTIFFKLLESWEN